MSHSDDMASLEHLEDDPEIQHRNSGLARALLARGAHEHGACI
jgi:hypothetical protein